MSWDPYLDLEHGLLRNTLGITDRAVLAQAEAELSALRLEQLEREDLPGHYDLTHLQAFHRHIFGEVYDWAGELRTVSIGKGMLFCLPQHLRSSGEALFVQLARHQYLRGLDRTAFVDDLAGFLGELNAAPVPRGQRPHAARLLRPARPRRRAPDPLGFAYPPRASSVGPTIPFNLDGDENITASKAGHAGDLEPLREMLDRLVSR